MSKNKDFREFEHSMEKIKEKKRLIEREEKQAMVKCAHQHHRKLRIRPISDQGDYRCKDCGAEFNIIPITTNELSRAIRTLHDAIQQIRCFADPSEDGKMISLLGESDFNNEEILKMYNRTLDAFGKNKKKDKFADREREQFGSYGLDAISLIGNKKHRK